MINYIKNEDYGLLEPCIIDKEKCNEKCYLKDGELNEKYYNLMSIYYCYLEQFLNNVLNIKEVEEGIDKDNPDFRPIPDDGKDLYQSISNNKYLYIRNTLYVEKLSDEDVNYLLSKKDGIIDKRIIDIIRNNFIDTIKGTYNGQVTDKTVACYGPSSTNEFIAPISSLVLGFRVSDEDEEKYGDGKEWLEYKDKKEKYIRELLERLSSEFSNKLGIKVNIFDYSEIGFLVKDKDGKIATGTTFKF